MKGGLSNNGELISSWSSTSKKERVQELRALNPKVKIIPTIFRWENPKEKIQENIGMGGRNDIRDHHIQVIVNEIMTYGYDGIDIDYEGMSCDKKEKFEEFFALLAREVHKKENSFLLRFIQKLLLKKVKRKNSIVVVYPNPLSSIFVKTGEVRLHMIMLSLQNMQTV